MQLHGPGGGKPRSNRIGIHAFVWVGGWSDAKAEYAARESRAAGYDFVELALLAPWA